MADKSPEEVTAIGAANAELIRRFGTATFRLGGARSYLWFEIYDRELAAAQAAQIADLARISHARA